MKIRKIIGFAGAFGLISLGMLFFITSGYADFITSTPGQQPAAAAPGTSAASPPPGVIFLPPTALNLFYSPSAFQDQQWTPMAMAYKVLLKLANEPCEVKEVNPANHVFRTNDRIRFKIQANSNGYLYIFQRGSDGSTNRLFPHPQFQNNQNQVAAYREYMIPVKGWFRFDQTPGIENIYLFLSKNRIPAFDVFPVAGHNPVAVPLNQQNWQVVFNHYNRSKRDLVLDTDPGQSGPNVYQTPICYVAQMASNQEPMISAEIKLSHQP